jgi:hypothetical protein
LPSVQLPPQQSESWKHRPFSMPQQLPATQVLPAQQSLVALQPWCVTAHAHWPFSQAPLQQWVVSLQGPPVCTQQLWPSHPRPAQQSPPSKLQGKSS